MHRSVLVAFVLSVALMGPAGATSGVLPTNLTIHADDAHVYGKLTGHPSCHDGQTIHLIVNGVETATTITGPDGRYSFDYALVPPVEVRTRFDGSIEGIHPETFVCKASLSRPIRFVPGAGPAKPSGATALTSSKVGAAAISLGAVMRTTLSTWLRGTDLKG